MRVLLGCRLSASFALSCVQRHQPPSLSLRLNLGYPLDSPCHRDHGESVRGSAADSAGAADSQPHDGPFQVTPSLSRSPPPLYPRERKTE